MGNLSPYSKAYQSNKDLVIIVSHSESLYFSSGNKTLKSFKKFYHLKNLENYIFIMAQNISVPDKID